VSASSAIARGQWRLEDTDDGWVLRVRPRVGIGEIIPFVRSKGMVFIVAMTLISLFIGMGAIEIPVPSRVLSQPTALVAVTLVLVSIGGWLLYAPPPFVDEYLAANRMIELRAHGARLETAAGQFAMHRLSTLGLTGDGALPGRRRMVFVGEVTPSADLIGWPGLPEATAAEVLAAVKDRIGD